ncbi:MAG TPA: hypothetical protein VEF06_01360 [Bryobacteraceae bacterium]|nr:hypothetical protein [Bryobacteraceae bacterium]
MKALRFFAILLVLDAAASAAGPSADVWSPADIGKVSSGLAHEAEAEDLAGKTLAAYGSHSAAVWRRARSGRAELHRTRTDLIVITEGEATLVSGGTIPDGKATSPVEVRGSSIAGGTSRHVGPGDIIHIPAGMPHQFLLGKDHTLTYFALKLPK